MKKIILVFLIYTITANISIAQSKSKGEVNKKIDKLVEKIIDSYKKLENAKYRNTIAVLDFEEKSKVANEKMIGFASSELLTTRLSETGLFNIVERKRLKKIIKEIQMGMTGLVDEETAAQAGKIVGADIMVIGSITELGNFFNLNVRLIEVETSEILTSTVEEIEKWLLISVSKTFLPSKHSLSIGSINLFASNNIDGGMLLATFNYAYQIDFNKALKVLFGIAYDGTQLVPQNEGGYPYGDIDTPTYLALVGYEHYFTNTRIRPFLGLFGGMLFPEYNTGYVEVQKGNLFCSMLQIGVGFVNPILSFKPSVGYFISGTAEYKPYVNVSGVNINPYREYGELTFGKFDSPILNLELVLRF